MTVGETSPQRPGRHIQCFVTAGFFHLVGLYQEEAHDDPTARHRAIYAYCLLKQLPERFGEQAFMWDV